MSDKSPEEAREAKARGGRSVPAHKRSFSQDRGLASRAGQKGGKSVAAAKRSFSLDPELAARAGRKGGAAARGGRPKAKEIEVV